jgi:leader peptidase (prepilin peptidase) / N-methyltransferase
VDVFFAISSFVLGLSFGSFLNVCIYRMPLGLSVVTPRSACPNCKHMIALYDNIPVVSWLILRGRCRYCQTKISPRYLIIELLTALLFLGCYWYFGLTLHLTLHALKYAIFGYLLLGLIFTDAETKLLPDQLTLPGLFIGLTFSLFVRVNDVASQFAPEFVRVPHTITALRILSFSDSLLGAIVGASFIYGAGAIYLRWRGMEGMGFGDVKLMAMVGAFLGVKLTVFTIFAASIAGTIFGMFTIFAVWIKRVDRLKRRSANAPPPRRTPWESAQLVYRYYQMPFGVFLGSMAMVALFFGIPFLNWYGRLF